jgi:hypothetical protein
MASIYNSTGGKYVLTHPYYNFDPQRWDDIQSYVSVTVTISCEITGTLNLRWINNDHDGAEPTAADTENPLAIDSFEYNGGSQTAYFDTRARWLSVAFDGSGIDEENKTLILSTNYKKAATEIKITDDDHNIVNVLVGDNHNMAYTILTDLSGDPLGTTNEAHTGHGLYVHAADASGYSLATTDHYRNVNRTDNSLYYFSDSIGCGCDGDISSTMILSENSFRVLEQEIGFRDGDTVRFVMMRDGDTLTLDEVFASDQGIDASGYLKATATVKFLAREPRHIRFQLLVDQNMSEWFDTNLGFTTGVLDEMELGDSQWTICGETVRLTDICGSSLATVDDYYNIIADVSGLDLSADGISLSPGSYPMDARFFYGSLDSQGKVTYITLDNSYNPAESLAVALRDSSNVDLASTYQDSNVGYYYRDTDLPRRKIYFIIDSHQDVSLSQHVVDMAKRFILKTEEVTGLTFNADSHNLGISILELSGSGIVQTDASFANTDISNTMIIDNNFTETISGKPDPWGLMRELVPDSIEQDSVNTFITFLSRVDISKNNLAKDSLDACYNIFSTVDRYVISPKITSDVLHLANGSENVILYDYCSNSVEFSENISFLDQTLVNRLFMVEHPGNVALAVAPTDVCGHVQAGTESVKGSYFPGTALYYALSDNCGNQLTTGRTGSDVDSSDNNALFVHLNSRSQNGGRSIDTNNPLPVAFSGQIHDAFSFDLTVSNHIITTPDISSGSLKINSLGIVNETAIPVWVRLYDTSSEFVETINDAVIDLSDSVIYNLAVPGLDTRDLVFTQGVQVNKGLHFLAATNYNYDSSLYPPGARSIFVHGTYSKTDDV